MFGAVGTVLLAQAAATLGAVQQLQPAAAGDLVLQGHTHGQIVSIVPSQIQTLAPATVIRDFVERAEPIAHGCRRKRWVVTFQWGPETNADGAHPTSAYDLSEVALASSAGCPDTGYVRLSTGVDQQQALSALTYLADIRTGRTRVHFSCSDHARTGLCRNEASIRRELASLPAIAVMREADTIVLWVGRPTSVSTQLRYRTTQPLQVRLIRAFPPPP